MSLAPVLALASAVCYGVVDLAGGLLARRADPTRVAFIAQVGALALTLPVALAIPGSTTTAGDLLWGGLSGMGTGLGMAFLYRGLAHGDFSAVVPLASAGGVVIPVVAGVAVLGDRPSIVAWVGMVVAVPALWFLLRSGRGTAMARESPGGTGDALVAGVGIAVQYLALAQANSAAGLWPIAAGRVTAIATVAPFALTVASRGRLGSRHVAMASLTGAGAAVALFLYLLAANEGMLAVTVVLASLYPVVPVVVGIAWYGEPVSKRKVIGLAAAALAVTLLSAG